MRFPVGLSTRLAGHGLLQAFTRDRAPAIFHLSPLVKHFPAGHQPQGAGPESEWHSPRACVQAADEAGASVVWIAGTEPLLHPEIGEVASTLVESGRYVFLHTNGVGLRKRIHELNPVDRLYLTVEVPTKDAVASGSAAIGPTASFHTAAEALSVARLSGFQVCAHLTACEGTSSGEIVARLRALRLRLLDGIAMSSGGALSHLKGTQTAHAVTAFTQLIPSPGWRRFSHLLESSYQEDAALREPAKSLPKTSACEETA